MPLLDDCCTKTPIEAQQVVFNAIRNMDDYWLIFVDALALVTIPTQKLFSETIKEEVGVHI
jgi:hypothetical protein